MADNYLERQYAAYEDRKKKLANQLTPRQRELAKRFYTRRPGEK